MGGSDSGGGVSGGGERGTRTVHRALVAGLLGSGGDGRPAKRLRQLLFLTVLLTVVLAVVVLSSLIFTLSGGRAMSVLAVAFVTSGAALVVGSLVGFLFGVPRALSATEAADSAAGAAGGGPRYAPNTRLEEISDWLTKIIVGVSLVEARQIAAGVEGMAAYVGPALGGGRTAEVFALGLLLFSAVNGFLLCYLSTRLLLRKELVYAETDHVRAAVHDAITQTLDANAAAMDVVLEQLTGAAGSVDYPRLRAAVEAASGATRVEVFNQARLRRQSAWRSGNADAVARTIPVFRALIDSDTERRYHRNFGQLGFALKDCAPADHLNAAEALSEAIEIRDRVGNPGHRDYEFNRAMCRIALDPDFAAGRPSADAVRGRVVADLHAAVASPFWSDVLAREAAQDTAVGRWLARNSLTVDALRQP